MLLSKFLYIFCAECLKCFTGLRLPYYHTKGSVSMVILLLMWMHVHLVILIITLIHKQRYGYRTRTVEGSAVFAEERSIVYQGRSRG